MKYNDISLPASIGLLAALSTALTVIFAAHLVIKWPSEPVWSSPAQIWDNYLIASSLLLNVFSYPLLSGLLVLLPPALAGYWIGRRFGGYFHARTRMKGQAGG